MSTSHVTLRRLSVLAFFCISSVSSIAQITSYSVIAARTLGDSTSSAAGISASGFVAGTSVLPGDKINHAFVGSPSSGSYTLVDLGALNGSSGSSAATAINANGVVVGTSTTGGKIPVIDAFVAQNNGSAYVIKDLGGFGGLGSAATAINASGAIVGSSTNSRYQIRAFYIAPPYTPNSMKDIGDLGGGFSLANGINSSGQVVGESWPGKTVIPHAFLINSPYAAKSMKDRGTLGGRLSIATAINDSGQVVGSSSIANDSAIHAFLSQPGASGVQYTMQDLGTLGGSFSQANAINTVGWIVGTSLTKSNAASHAFVFAPATVGGIGKMVDLNTLIPTNSGWVLNAATGINDAGQITGTGTLNGQQQFFVLSPPGNYVYVTNGNDNNVSIYSYSSSTGFLTLRGTAAAGRNPSAVTTVKIRAKSYVYVTNGTDNTVSMYQINAASGALTSLGTVAAGSNPNGVVVGPGNKFAYVVNKGSNTVSQYGIDQSTGKLAATGSPLPTGQQPVSIAIASTQSGQYAYVANTTDQSISMYSINTSSGALTSLGVFQGLGFNPSSVTVGPGGTYAFVSSDDFTLTTLELSIAQQNETLSNSGNAAAAGWPLAMDPSGSGFYAVSGLFFTTGSCFPPPCTPPPSQTITDISSYGIGSSGTVTQADTSAEVASTTGGPNALVVAPSGGYVYLAAGNAVYMFKTSSSGALTLLSPGSVATGNGPSSMAISQ